ncbi:DNA-directed RNA polymerase subunit alpha C-terminal domain-containing protein [Desulfococcaceae bacterium HSG7]|nr:DNA-directed RNA polymerase subunit alpha C-terminal domain-containing protein [Desulfococcaceae bacterium HSG7]
MIITCNNCSISYAFKKKVIKEKGIRVRCKKCKTVFKVFLPSNEHSNNSTSNEPLIKGIKDFKNYIENAGISVRATNVLLSNIKNVEQFLELKEEKIIEFKNCGKKTLTELLKFKIQLSEKLGYDISQKDQAPKAEPLIIPERIKKNDNFYRAIKQQLSVRARNIVDKNAIDSIEKFMALDSGELLKFKNCGRKTVSEITKYQNKIADLIRKNVSTKDIKTVQNDRFIDFAMPNYSVEKWVFKICKNSLRKKQIFMLRMGMRGDAPMTLEQIGVKFDITRERVRQILVDIEKTARHHIHKQTVSTLINRILGIVRARGGKITDATLLYQLFERKTDNKMMRFASPFIELLSTMHKWKEVGLKLNKNGVIYTDECMNLISQIASEISKIATQNADEVISDNLWSIDYGVLKELVINWCNKEGSNDRIYELSDTVIQDALSTCSPKLKKRIDRVYSNNLWKLRFGKANKAIETTLKNSCKAMHFSDVYNELKKFRPHDDSLTERYVHTVLSRHQNVLLFDRGTYIHKKHITIPHDLINDIEKWILAKLRKDVPFISSFGPFKIFEKQCLESQIPNEGALYSILRHLSHPLIAYPKLPYIYLNRGEINRIPISLTLEKFVQDADGPVANKDLKAYSLNKLYLKPFQFDTIKYNIPNTIRMGNEGFLHADYLNLDMDRFNDIINYTHDIINKEGHISIKKIYAEID